MMSREIDNWPQIRVRVRPALHEVIKKAAEAENRSMANWIDTVVMNALMTKGYKNDVRKAGK